MTEAIAAAGNGQPRKKTVVIVPEAVAKAAEWKAKLKRQRELLRTKAAPAASNGQPRRTKKTTPDPATRKARIAKFRATMEAIRAPPEEEKEEELPDAATEAVMKTRAMRPDAELVNDPYLCTTAAEDEMEEQEFHKYPSLRKFLRLPYWLLAMQNLSLSERVVLAQIWFWAGAGKTKTLLKRPFLRSRVQDELGNRWWESSFTQLAWRTGLSLPTVKRVVKSLRQKKLIFVKLDKTRLRRSSNDVNWYRPNIPTIRLAAQEVADRLKSAQEQSSIKV